MPDNIAGYIDRSYVKGSTYKYAADPIPTVFTGNIDIISDDLLVKAMLVVNNGANGTFPTATSGTYLIRTIEYGNAILLQSAVDFGTSIEYRRINSNGAWTDWVSANDEVAGIENSITSINTTLDGYTSKIGNLETKVTTLSNDSAVAKTDLSNHETRIRSLESKVIGSQTSTNILDCIANNSYSRSTVTSCYFTRVGAICSLTLAIKTKTSITSGSNILSVAPGPLVEQYWPPYIVYGNGYYGNNSVPISFTTPNNIKTIIVRNAGSDTINTGANMQTNVIWTYSEGGEE